MCQCIVQTWQISLFFSQKPNVDRCSMFDSFSWDNNHSFIEIHFHCLCIICWLIILEILLGFLSFHEIQTFQQLYNISHFYSLQYFFFLPENQMLNWPELKFVMKNNCKTLTVIVLLIFHCWRPTHSKILVVGGYKSCSKYSALNI